MTDHVVTEDKRRTVALAFGKQGAFVSVDGAEPRHLKLAGGCSAESLAKALGSLDDPGNTLLVLGTRSDGTPGIDGIDPAELTALLPHCVVAFMSEAHALHHTFSPEGTNAYIILATALRSPEPRSPKRRGSADDSDPNIVGSARWWVQRGDKIEPVPVTYLQNTGNIFTLGGGNLADAPNILVGMVERLLADHPDVTRVCVWSQDGLAKNQAYKEGGDFWKWVRLPAAFTGRGGRVLFMPTATELIKLASGAELPATTASETETTPAAGATTAPEGH